MNIRKHHLIFFVLSAALLGGCATPEAPLPSGAAKLVIPEAKPPALPISNTILESRNAMTRSQRFNNDVSYELRLIDVYLYGDEDVYLYGQYFCTMRETYTAAEVQAKTAESIAASPADQEVVNTTRLNVTYRMAMTTLCPNTKKK